MPASSTFEKVTARMLGVAVVLPPQHGLFNGRLSLHKDFGSHKALERGILVRSAGTRPDLPAAQACRNAGMARSPASGDGPGSPSSPAHPSSETNTVHAPVHGRPNLGMSAEAGPDQFGACHAENNQARPSLLDRFPNR